MNTKSQNARIIFGLKVKQLRQAKNLSFSELSKQSGVSISYLNEIEKGKKYPKSDKVTTLAKALEVKVEELTSFELSQNLAPVGDLLNSNFLSELPLDLFGIELSKVVEIIANAPTRVGAFISTLVELARNYSLREENFYFGALRSYLELHDNYFEEIEQAVITFSEKNKIPTKGKVSIELLSNILRKQYRYKISEDEFAEHPELKELRSVYIPNKKKLLLDGNLSDVQKAFQLAKELSFNYLELKDRANTSSLLEVKSFEEVLNHFKANYFAAALLINRASFLEDLNDFLNSEKWSGEAITQLMNKYTASPEMLLQRMSNLLPRFFGLKQLFLLRFLHTPATDYFNVDKELHLNKIHRPHSNGLYEHYCRRWLSLSLLKDLQKMQQEGKYVGAIVGIQRSKYFGTEDEYLCITFARQAYPSPDKNASVTVGILVDDALKAKVNFLDDPTISTREVNITCQRCAIKDCAERAAPSTVVDLREKRRKVQKALVKLGEE